MKIIQEFKAFVMRGNVVDLAIGVIIGVAFGKIITSMVNNVLMPPIGLLTGKVDFKSLFLNLSSTPYATLADADAVKAPVIRYGAFINSVVEFVIVAFCVFMVVKLMNQLIKKEEAKPAPPTPTEQLLTEIRDLLKTRP